MLDGSGIFTYICHKFTIKVGMDIPYMEHPGMVKKNNDNFIPSVYVPARVNQMANVLGTRNSTSEFPSAIKLSTHYDTSICIFYTHQCSAQTTNSRTTNENYRVFFFNTDWIPPKRNQKNQHAYFKAWH